MKGLLRPGKAGTGSAVPKVDYRGDPWRYGESQPEYGIVAFNWESVKGLYVQCALRGIPLFYQSDSSSSSADNLNVLLYKSETQAEVKKWSVYAEELGLSADEKARVEADALERTERSGLTEEIIRYAWCRNVWFPKTVLHFFNSEGKACLRLAGSGRAKLHVRDGWSDVTVVDATSFSFEVDIGQLGLVGHNLAQAWLERVSTLGTLEDGSVGELPAVETERRSDWHVAREDGEPSYPVPWRANKKGLITLSMWAGGMLSETLSDVIPGGEATGGKEVGFYGTLREACDRVVGDRYGELMTGGGYSETRDVAMIAESLRSRFKGLVPNATDATLRAFIPELTDWEYPLQRPGVYEDSDGNVVAVVIGPWVGRYDDSDPGDTRYAKTLCSGVVGTPGGSWDKPGSNQEVKAGEVGAVDPGLKSAGVATDGATRSFDVKGVYIEEARPASATAPIKVHVTLRVGARTRVADVGSELFIPGYITLKGNVGRTGGDEDVQELENRLIEGKSCSVVPASDILRTVEVGGVLCYEAHQTVKRTFETTTNWNSVQCWYLEFRDDVKAEDLVYKGYEFGDWAK